MCSKLLLFFVSVASPSSSADPAAVSFSSDADSSASSGASSCAVVAVVVLATSAVVSMATVFARKKLSPWRSPLQKDHRAALNPARVAGEIKSRKTPIRLTARSATQLRGGIPPGGIFCSRTRQEPSKIRSRDPGSLPTIEVRPTILRSQHRIR